MLAHFLILSACELLIIVHMVEVAMEARFKRETVRNVEFTPHYYSCGLQFRLLEAEAARVIPKLLSFLGNQLGYNTHFEVVGCVERLLRAINEDVLLSRVSVHIDKGHDVLVDSLWFINRFFSFFVGTVNQVTCQLLDGANSRMDAKIWLHIASVKVISRHACPVIANDDAIDVDHGDAFEDDAFSELLGLVRVTQYKLDKALHHVGAVRLARMDPSRYDRILFLLVHRQRQL